MEKTRIEERILKDGTKEYYPQILLEVCATSIFSVGKEPLVYNQRWHWISESPFFNSSIDSIGGKYETRLNDYKSVCKTKEEAIAIIKTYLKQCEEFHRKNDEYCKNQREYRDSIISTNYIEVKP